MRSPLCLAAVVVAALAGTAVQAQTTSSSYDTGRKSWIPYTTNGYVGLSVGKPHYSINCGGFGCDQPSVSGNVYLGGMFNPYVGAEVGYVHFGDADFPGGRVKAEGINLSVVGRVPVWQSLSVFGKLGTTYGRTHVDAPIGFVGGKESGWGPAYAVGVSWDFNNNWSAVLDMQRHRFDFAGDQDAWVRSTNLGLKYRF